MGIPAGPKSWQDHTNPFIVVTECLVSYVREEGICLAYSLRGFSPPWQGRPDCCRKRKLEVAARTASARGRKWGDEMDVDIHAFFSFSI